MMTFKTYLRDLEEKNLSQVEIRKLIKRAQQAVKNVLQDSSKKAEHRSRAKEVLQWIESVRSTYRNQGSLHPNAVTGLYRIIAGVSSGRFGYAHPEYATSGSGKVPKDFRR